MDLFELGDMVVHSLLWKSDQDSASLVLSLRFFGFLVSVCFSGPEKPQRWTFMNGHMIGLVALNEVLRFVFRGVMYETLDPNVRSDLLDNHTANSARLGIPFNVVASPEYSWHRSLLKREYYLLMRQSPLGSDRHPGWY